MYINAAEYLEEIRSTRIAINNKRRELKACDHMIDISGISYDGDKVAISPRQDGLERKVIAHLEKCSELRAEIAEMLEWMHNRIDEAVNYINQIESDEQKDVLMLRYIEHHTWAEIMDIRECDDISGQCKLRNRAIASLQRVMEGAVSQNSSI